MLLFGRLLEIHQVLLTRRIRGPLALNDALGQMQQERIFSLSQYPSINRSSP